MVVDIADMVKRYLISDIGRYNQLTERSSYIVALAEKGRYHRMGSWENSVEIITGHSPVTDTLTLTLIYLSKQSLFRVYHFLSNLTTFSL